MRSVIIVPIALLVPAPGNMEVQKYVRDAIS